MTYSLKNPLLQRRKVFVSLAFNFCKSIGFAIPPQADSDPINPRVNLSNFYKLSLSLCNNEN